MKRIIFLAWAVIFDIGCNNESSRTDDSDTTNTGKQVYDSMPRSGSGDTSSYERMPNRISDSADQ